MGTYEHGFVVKSQEELEELMGPFDSSDSWHNRKNEWADSFVSEMTEYIGKPYFGKSHVITASYGNVIYDAWGWNFDTRWVHELKRCTFEELVKSKIPFDKIYAVCVPDDRISGLTEDDVDLVPPDKLEVLYIEQN